MIIRLHVNISKTCCVNGWLLLGCGIRAIDIVIRITIVVQNTTLCFVIVIVKSQDKYGTDENVGVYPKNQEMWVLKYRSEECVFVRIIIVLSIMLDEFQF